MTSLRPFAVLAALAACAPPSPDAPAGDAPASTTSATARASEPAAPSSAPSAAATTEATAQPAADTRVRDACAKLCERVKTSCPAGRGEACLAQCQSHEAKSKGCEGEVEAALACQAAAPDGLCDNVASARCTEAFVRMQRCQRGEKPAPSASKADAVPDGWERVKDETWGVSLLVPKGTLPLAGEKTRTYRATVDGTTYEVVELKRPDKLEDQPLLKLVLAHVGISCQKELKLNGRVDSDKLTFFRFETACAKGGERLRGKVRIDAQRALSLVVRGGSKPELGEAFLEGLR